MEKTKAIYLTRQEAENEAKASGREYFISIADDSSIEESHFDMPWSGEVQCFRTYEGDVFAWWENE